MTGILVVTHSNLGRALIDTLEFIHGGVRPERTAFVSIDIKDPPDRLLGRIKKAIRTVGKGAGVLILTDMFGGTPSNLSYSFLEENAVEVVTGVNLPMLLKAVEIRDKHALSDIAVTVSDYGRQSISRAGGILAGDENRQET